MNQELLLLLARGTFSESARERALSLLDGAIDWNALLEQARVQQVLPLVHRNLKTLGFPHTPRHVRSELEAVAVANAMRNELLARELRAVLRDLDRAGVPALPLKGVALAERLYGDIALRVCADIDVLVPRPLVVPALRRLQARGYRAEFPERFFVDLLLRSDIECALARHDKGFRYALDLHWAVLWGGSLDGAAAESLWADARAGTWWGVPAFTLSPEWELLYLATHAARQQWRGLKWLVDLREVCASPEIDWTRARAVAHRLGWEPILDSTLGVVAALFETAVQPTRGARLPRGAPASLMAAPATDGWGNPVERLSLLTRPTDRLRWLLRLLLVPTLADRRAVRLPSGVCWLYFLVRPARLAGRFGGQAVRACARRLTTLARPRWSRRCGTDSSA